MVRRGVDDCDPPLRQGDRAAQHLATVDPVLARLIGVVGPFVSPCPGDPYESLVRSVMFQQLGGSAAQAILDRVLCLFGAEGQYPTPADLLAASDDTLRGAGVSRQKITYLRDVAERLQDGRLDLGNLGSELDVQVIEHLTSVKGVGTWTAQMFLIFQLGRLDVLPVGDLGVRRGMKLAYKLDELPSETEAATIGQPWAPYRSVGAWYMWRAVDLRTPC